jgi:hypothetical protein
MPRLISLKGRKSEARILPRRRTAVRQAPAVTLDRPPAAWSKVEALA